MKHLLLSLAAGALISAAPEPWTVKLLPGAEFSQALVCERSAPRELTCGDFASFLRQLDASRAAAAARAQRLEDLKDSWESQRWLTL